MRRPLRVCISLGGRLRELLVCFAALSMVLVATRELVLAADCTAANADRCATGTIQALEWFIDLEGAQLMGNAALPPGTLVTGPDLPAAISSCDSRDLEFEIPASIVATLTPGFHYLYIRAQLQNGDWGELGQQIFEVSGAGKSPVSFARVFFDEEPIGLDPGAAQGAAEVNISWLDCSTDSPSPWRCAEIEVDISALEAGQHTLFLAPRDAAGFYFVPQQAVFVKDDPADPFCPPSLLSAQDAPGFETVLGALPPDACVADAVCYEALIDRAQYPGARGFLQLCSDYGDAGGFWVDLSGIGGFVSAVELVDGEPASLTITPGVPEHFLQFRVPPGATVDITVSNPSAGKQTHLHARFGERPTDALFDAEGAPSSALRERLVITSHSTREEILFVRVRGTLNPGDAQYTVVVKAEVVPVALKSIFPTVAARGGDPCDTSISVQGAGLNRNPQFFLRLGAQGALLPACAASIVTAERAEVFFSIETASLGNYDFIARVNGQADEMLAAAFEITEGVTGGLVDVSFSALDRARADHPTRLTVRYQNPGDTEIPAPLFLVRAPEGVKLRLDRDADYQGNEIYFLGFQSSGNAGRLSPGGSGEVVIIFEASLPTATRATFEVYQLQATRRNFVGWDRQPPPVGMPAGEWQRIQAGVSASLGASWIEYEQSLGRIASENTRLGVQPASVRAHFGAAIARVLNPTKAAIVGRLFDLAGVPLAGVTLLAVSSEDGESSPSVVTDAEGAFVLTCVQRNVTYELKVVDHELLPPTEVTVPPDGDGVLVTKLHAFVDDNPLGPGLPCEPVPAYEPIAVPSRFMLERSSFNVRVIGSLDPNDKVGPEGSGEADPLDLTAAEITIDDEIHYTIYFENIGEAPVKTLIVEDLLPVDRLDPASVIVRELVIGKQLISLDHQGGSQLNGYTAPLPPLESGPRIPQGSRLDLAEAIFDEPFDPSRRLPVDVAVSLDANGKLTWSLTSTPSEFGGFLAGLDPEGNDEGHVTFSIRPKRELAELGVDEIDIINEALITFDQNPPLRRLSQIPVKIKFKPLRPRNPVPADGGSALELTQVDFYWQAGRGVTYSLFVWPCQTGGPCQPAPSQRPPDGDPSLLVEEHGLERKSYPLKRNLTPGAFYHWQVSATNIIDTTEGPVWTFQAPPLPPACPEAPRNLAPTDGLTNVDSAGSLSFSWEPASRATAYAVLLTKDGGPEFAVAKGIEGTAISLSGVLEPSSRYSWRVAAANLNPDCGPNGSGTPSTPFRFTTGVGAGGPVFRRGDADGDGKLAITDPIRTLGYLFLGSDAPPCEDAADTDDSGALNITDAVASLAYLFSGGAAPAPPGPDVCGRDPTSDALAVVCKATCP